MAKVKKGLAATKARAIEVYDALAEHYPDVRCSLEHRSPFQLLVMTILAAQCTDARVNIVSKDLFKHYPTPQAFVKTPPEKIEEAIRTCGFFRAKTKSILNTSAALIERHGGEVPGSMEELTALPGVGRKTANVILGECFGKQGVVVDTHCTRVANRLGFTTESDAVKIEKDLMKVWPPDRWTLFSHLMVFHGRAICVARGPKCSQCPVYPLCPFPDTPEGKKIAK